MSRCVCYIQLIRENGAVSTTSITLLEKNYDDFSLIILSFIDEDKTKRHVRKGNKRISV